MSGVKEKTVIQDRKTIYEALMNRFCEHCGFFYPGEYGCEYEESHNQDEDQCLVTLVMNTLSDWDWPDREDLTIFTSGKRTDET